MADRDHFNTTFSKAVVGAAFKKPPDGLDLDALIQLLADKFAENCERGVVYKGSLSLGEAKSHQKSALDNLKGTIYGLLLPIWPESGMEADGSGNPFPPAPLCWIAKEK
jgi:hypothetical protein